MVAVENEVTHTCNKGGLPEAGAGGGGRAPGTSREFQEAGGRGELARCMVVPPPSLPEGQTLNPQVLPGLFHGFC